MLLKTEIEKAILLKEKTEEIVKIILHNYKDNDIGLLTGNGGIAIFLLLYAHYSDEEFYQDKAMELISASIEKINAGYSQHTYCTGIGGFLWSLMYLANNDFINKEEITDILNEMDDYLYNKMITDIRAGNFDYLHGAIGNGLYFLERINDNEKAKKYLLDLVLELENQCHGDVDGSKKWLSVVDHETGEKAYNLSLSHGIASIIAFLGKMYEKNIHKEKVSSLLNASIKYLLKNLKNPLGFGCYFPAWINDKELKKGGRLAWCYNDLGIAMVLLQISKIIKNKDLEQKAIEILLFNADRRNLVNEGVVDAGLCHGAAGIAHIYNRVYRLTNIEKFKETKDFWFNETLRLANHEDGLAGYKVWKSEKYGGWVNEFGLLEGISGIGLAMLSDFSDIETNWDQCLLLS